MCKSERMGFNSYIVVQASLRQLGNSQQLVLLIKSHAVWLAIFCLRCDQLVGPSFLFQFFQMSQKCLGDTMKFLLLGEKNRGVGNYLCHPFLQYYAQPPDKPSLRLWEIMGKYRWLPSYTYNGNRCECTPLTNIGPRRTSPFFSKAKSFTSFLTLPGKILIKSLTLIKLGHN